MTEDVKPIHAIDIAIVPPDSCDLCREVLIPSTVAKIFLCRRHLNELKQDASVEVTTCGRPSCPNCHGQKERFH